MPDLDDEELRATRKLNGVDIQVGDYVRTKDGYIAKVIEMSNRIVWFDACIYKNGGIPNYGINKETQFHIITKHSKNIIDLIKVGDYVNGELITEIAKEINNKTIIGNETCYMEEKDIKTIVTHEQFNSIMYKVEE